MQNIAQTQHSFQIIIITHDHQSMHPTLAYCVEDCVEPVVKTACVDTGMRRSTFTQGAADSPGQIAVVAGLEDVDYIYCFKNVEKNACESGQWYDRPSRREGRRG